MVQSRYRKCDDEVAHCAKGLATAKMRLFLAQSGYRNRENEIVHCAKGLASAKMSLLLAQSGYRNRDNEIVHCAKWLSQPRWRTCSLHKGIFAVAGIWIEVGEGGLFKCVGGYFSA